MRISQHPVLGVRPEQDPVFFFFNGRMVEGRAGEPIAVALLAAGELTLRSAEKAGDRRGVYCGMGHCYECRVTVDGIPNVRACLTPVRPGMRVEG